jgi:WD40 repeat protein
MGNKVASKKAPAAKPYPVDDIVQSLAVSGEFVVCTDWKGRIHVFETASGKRRHLLKPTKTEQGFRHVDFNNGTNQFACHCDPNLIQIRNVETGKCLLQIEGAWGLGLKPNNGEFLVGIDPMDDEVLKIWDWKKPEQRLSIKMNRPLEEGQSDICYLAFSLDGKSLATSGSHTPLEIWDLATGRIKGRVSGWRQQFTCVDFSPDNEMIAGSDAYGHVRLWNVKTEKLANDIEASEKRIEQIRFSPDGKMLAACGEDATIRLFDPASGDLLLTIKTAAIVNCLAFTSDSKFLYSGGSDKRIRKWDTKTGAEIGAKK